MNTSLFAVTVLIGVLAVSPAEAGSYQLKNRSELSVSDEERNPFWPIGWVKPARGTNGAAKAPTVALKAEAFSVSSISIMGGARYAVVNGRVYGEGEVVQTLINNRKVPVQIVAIRDGGVIVSYGGQTLNVLLKRKEDQPLNRPVKAPEESALETES